MGHFPASVFLVCVCSVFRCYSISSCARKLSLFFDFQLEGETTSLFAFICHLLFFLSITPPLSSPFHSLLFTFSPFLIYVSPPVIRNQVFAPLCPGPHLGPCDVIWSRSPFSFSHVMTSSPSHHWILNSLCLTCHLPVGSQAYSTIHKPSTVDDYWTIGLPPGCHPCDLVTTSDWRQWYKASGLSVFSLSISHSVTQPPPLAHVLMVCSVFVWCGNLYAFKLIRHHQKTTFLWTLVYNVSLFSVGECLTANSPGSSLFSCHFNLSFFKQIVFLF